MRPVPFQEVVLHFDTDAIVDTLTSGSLDDSFQGRTRIATEGLTIAPEHRTAEPPAPLIRLPRGQHRKGRGIGRQIEIQLDTTQPTGECRSIEPIPTLKCPFHERGWNSQRLGAAGDIAEDKIDEAQSFRAHLLDHVT